MLSAAQAARLAELHEVVKDALRDALASTRRPAHWWAACQARDAAQSAFAEYLESLVEKE